MSYLHCPTCQRAYNLATQPTCPRCHAAEARPAAAAPPPAPADPADAIVAALDQLARAMQNASADDMGRVYAELEQRAVFALPEPAPRAPVSTAIVHAPQPIAHRRAPLRKRLQAWARPTVSAARAHLSRLQQASSTLARALR